MLRVVDEVEEEDYDPLKGRMILSKANLIPFAEAKNYRVHWGKVKG